MIYWYILTAISLISAICVILVKNPMYSILCLVFTFLSLSIHYFLLNAQFIGAVNLIVYAGAIMVLFLFVIMMLDFRRNLPDSKSTAQKWLAASGGIGLMVVMGLILKANNFAPIPDATGQVGMVENLGAELFSKYLLPFEMISLLFFVAIVGAVLLGKRETGERHF